jgi:hypothetical protein
MSLIIVSIFMVMILKCINTINSIIGNKVNQMIYNNHSNFITHISFFRIFVQTLGVSILMEQQPSQNTTVLI